jgi:hypothetical protein
MKATFRLRTTEELRKQAQAHRDAAETAADPEWRALCLRIAERHEALAKELGLENQEALQAGPHAPHRPPDMKSERCQ